MTRLARRALMTRPGQHLQLRMNISPSFEIVCAFPQEERLITLLQTHADYCSAHTPEGSGHAIAPEVFWGNPIEFWAAVDGNRALGCIGLGSLGPLDGEVKSLHVLAEMRGLGIGEALLERLITEARQQGMTTVSLETGKSEGFLASRKLYEKMGFVHCEPFGPYREDPFSFCMRARIV